MDPRHRDIARRLRAGGSACRTPDAASNITLEQTAGSHALAAAAQRERSAHLSRVAEEA
jgi:hypothetical protein